jgi:hypothetical protein
VWKTPVRRDLGIPDFDPQDTRHNHDPVGDLDNLFNGGHGLAPFNFFDNVGRQSRLDINPAALIS